MYKKARDSVFSFFKIDTKSQLIKLLASKKIDIYAGEYRALVKKVVEMDFEERGQLQHQVNKSLDINKPGDIGYDEVVANSKKFFKEVHWWHGAAVLRKLKNIDLPPFYRTAAVLKL